MLQDPENPSQSWEQEVFAPDLGTAKAMCEVIARKYPLTEVVNVSQETKTRNKSGNFRFICWFQAEVTEDDDSSN